MRPPRTSRRQDAAASGRGRPDDRHPGFVVELFGLPGAGKSRLAIELVRASADLGLQLDRSSARVDPETPTSMRVPRKLGLAAAECARRPARSGVAARAILRSQFAGGAAGVPRWAHWLVMQRLMTSARATPGAHLFDEGVLQALWSVGLRGDATAALERIAAVPERWALPDLVVFVSAPLDVLDRRLSARASRHSRLQAGDDARARRKELARGRALAERILWWWADEVADTRPVVRIDNGPEVTLEDAASAAIRQIAHHVDTRGRGPRG